MNISDQQTNNIVYETRFLSVRFTDHGRVGDTHLQELSSRMSELSKSTINASGSGTIGSFPDQTSFDSGTIVTITVSFSACYV